jgi:hypothetical protein
MDEIREELSKKSIDAWKMFNEMQEEILIAFMAKYGLQPEEVVLCHQGTKIWVERKP